MSATSERLRAAQTPRTSRITSTKRELRSWADPWDRQTRNALDSLADSLDAVAYKHHGTHPDLLDGLALLVEDYADVERD